MTPTQLTLKGQQNLDKKALHSSSLSKMAIFQCLRRQTLAVIPAADLAVLARAAYGSSKEAASASVSAATLPSVRPLSRTQRPSVAQQTHPSTPAPCTSCPPSPPS